MLAELGMVEHKVSKRLANNTKWDPVSKKPKPNQNKQNMLVEPGMVGISIMPTLWEAEAGVALQILA